MLKKLIATVEIPQGSNIKYEYQADKQKIAVDRILRAGFFYPANYGFFENTLDYDGDALDVLIYSPEKFLPGSQIKVNLIGAMQMIDSGETDTKLIATHADDYRLAKIKTIQDLGAAFLESLRFFFSNYKNWKGPGQTKVGEFLDLEAAQAILAECQALKQNYGALNKEEFIAQMKKLHPEKYSKV